MMETFPREHDYDPSWSESVLKTNNLILHKLFLLHVRLSTHKESPQDFFSSEFWGQMLYDKYIIEMPRILDMCVLFQSCNRSITSKMVGNVFKQQPEYNNDLLECLVTISSALDSVGDQYQVLSVSQPSVSGHSSLLDIVQYCLDISVTMSSLVSVHPPSSHHTHNTGLDLRLAGFYSSVLTNIVTLIHKFRSAQVISESQVTSLMTRVDTSRHNIITCLRDVVSHLCFLDTMTVSERLESFFNMMTSLMGEVSFLSDYNELYSIRAEFEQFESEGVSVDSVRKHYILDLFNDSHTESFMNNGANNIVKQSSSTSLSAAAGVAQDNMETMGACALVNKPTPVELVSLVSSVRDLLPHLGEGFVEHVLEEYNYKVDEAINALLENNLPPRLMSLDQSLPKLEMKNESPAPEPVMRSVYDEDEFDVFNRDHIDTSKVHKGKKNKLGDAKKLLDDKTDVLKMKDKFDRLGIVEDVEIVARTDQAEHGTDYDYDDEYDDTYDDVDYGQQEPDAKDDLGREFVLPVALGGGKIKNGNNRANDQEDEESDDEEQSKTKMNFCRNPEEIRQENERRRQEKLARKHHNHGGANRDVVGRARGQGQDKQVLINRAKKNVNKGKGQRAGADRKAAKGMF